jgi:hypothetical protein
MGGVEKKIPTLVRIKREWGVSSSPFAAYLRPIMPNGTKASLTNTITQMIWIGKRPSTQILKSQLVSVSHICDPGLAQQQQ